MEKLWKPFILIYFIITGSHADARRENLPCAYSFHVWNPGNDIIQKVKDVDNKVDNITGHVDREFLKMKVVVLQELKQCQNWTIHLEREISDLKMKSLRGRIIERDTSNTMTDVERDMVDLRKKVGHLKHNYQRLQKNYQELTLSDDSTKAKHQMPTHNNKFLEMLENAVRDLKAEWVVLKRDVIQLQMEQREVKLGQNHRSNNTFHLSSSIKTLANKLTDLEKTQSNITSTLQLLSNSEKKFRADLKSLDGFDNKRLELAQGLTSNVSSINGKIENLTQDLKLLKNDNGFLKELVIQSTKSSHDDNNGKETDNKKVFTSTPKGMIYKYLSYMLFRL